MITFQWNLYLTSVNYIFSRRQMVFLHPQIYYILSNIIEMPSRRSRLMEIVNAHLGVSLRYMFNIKDSTRFTKISTAISRAMKIDSRETLPLLSHLSLDLSNIFQQIFLAISCRHIFYIPWSFS